MAPIDKIPTPEVKICFWNGQEIALPLDWLRVTENPIAPRFPTVGTVIELRGHKMLSDGKYLVTEVKEYEPAYRDDGDGRDIRISVLASDKNWELFSRSRVAGSKGWDGVNILEAMV